MYLFMSVRMHISKDKTFLYLLPVDVAWSTSCDDVMFSHNGAVGAESAPVTAAPCASGMKSAMLIALFVDSITGSSIAPVVAKKMPDCLITSHAAQLHWLRLAEIIM